MRQRGAIVLVGCLVFATFSSVLAQAATVDPGDLPPIQKENAVDYYDGEKYTGGNETKTEAGARWDSLEQDFMARLDNSEKENYMALHEYFVIQRAELVAKRDSLANLTPEQRKKAIDDLRNDVNVTFDQMEEQMMCNLTLEQQAAKRQQNLEIQRKRDEIKKYLGELKDRLQSRLQ